MKWEIQKRNDTLPAAQQRLLLGPQDLQDTERLADILADASCLHRENGRSQLELQLMLVGPGQARWLNDLTPERFADMVRSEQTFEAYELLDASPDLCSARSADGCTVLHW